MKSKNTKIQKWINGLREEDDLITIEVYKEMLSVIKAMVFNKGGTEEEAFDVTHRTLLKVIKLIQNNSYEEQGKFQGYYIRIAYHFWIEVVKQRNKRKTDNLEGLHLAAAPKEYDNGRRNDEMTIFIDYVKEHHKECYELIYDKYYKEMKSKIIAKQKGITDSYVDAQLTRCKKKFQKMYQDWLIAKKMKNEK